LTKGDNVRRALLLFVVPLVIALSGCDSEEAYKSEVDFGKRLVADLQAGSFDAIEKQVDQGAWGDGWRTTLTRMAKRLPKGEPTSIRIAELTVNRAKSADAEPARYVSLALQYQFDNTWLVVAAQWLRKDDGSALLQVMRLLPLPASLDEIHRFTLEGRGPVHYAALALAVMLPLFTLLAVVLCIRTPMPYWRKALWLVAVLIGVTSLRFNWTSATMFWQPLDVLVGSAAYHQAELGPAFLSIAFPLGAFAFLLRRRSIVRAAARKRARAAQRYEHESRRQWR
jgi:hypothetical protein